jgi:hypothetical protein
LVPVALSNLEVVSLSNLEVVSLSGQVALSNLEVVSLSGQVASCLLAQMGEVASYLSGQGEVTEVVPLWYHHVHDVVLKNGQLLNWVVVSIVSEQEVKCS